MIYIYTVTPRRAMYPKSVISKSDTRFWGKLRLEGRYCLEDRHASMDLFGTNIGLIRRKLEKLVHT